MRQTPYFSDGYGREMTDVSDDIYKEIYDEVGENLNQTTDALISIFETFGPSAFIDKAPTREQIYNRLADFVVRLGQDPKAKLRQGPIEASSYQDPLTGCHVINFYLRVGQTPLLVLTPPGQENTGESAQI